VQTENSASEERWLTTREVLVNQRQKVNIIPKGRKEIHTFRAKVSLSRIRRRPMVPLPSSGLPRTPLLPPLILLIVIIFMSHHRSLNPTHQFPSSDRTLPKPSSSQATIDKRISAQRPTLRFQPEDEPLHAWDDIKRDGDVKWNPRDAEEKGRETTKEECDQHEEAKEREDKRSEHDAAQRRTSGADESSVYCMGGCCWRKWC
jgi:hypothetical protein